MDRVEYEKNHGGDDEDDGEDQCERRDDAPN